MQIKRTLGRGAMGVVYEGWDPTIHRRVAIKTVPPPNADDPETRRRWPASGARHRPPGG